MNFHTAPVVKSNTPQLGFCIRNGELVLPGNKLYTKDEYPSLPCDMVKIASRDGRYIYVPASKFQSLSTADF